ncbi:WXG100 family type VII secretion target [Streptomyces lydicus]|uniref:WXG100 family type VII secretion target n=1 Tax=Streptomyces lydicus TaxID=47763 RepID=UPI00101124E2|nr:WXG100 family type VII secretion target [Streptomyces lydicus]MCZ1007834.1 WXG100 family type VII secretion target [Streptomyces lydicus]
MTTYQVSLEQMSFAEGEMQAIAQKIQQTLDELEANANKSLANWDSAAREAYEQQRLQWKQGAEAMQQQAVKAAQGLNVIGQHYNDGEKYGVNLWEQ